MTTRPLVQVYNSRGAVKDRQVKLPGVFSAPLRIDIVQDVFVNMNKNSRQPYAVSKTAGEQTSASSWGTGRAVARIPRVSGGGTHRAGQGAFGNMCRGGRMFSPTKIWRRWHRKINVNQRRFALTSALVATAVPALVMARGHRIDDVNEIPLVVADESIHGLSKTKHAVAFLEKLGLYDELMKVKDSRQIRRGKGKMRNRRHVARKGPLVVFLKKGNLARAFRNVPGVDLCCVTRLNLLQLAPGGHVGRFVIWTESAFKELEALYGSEDSPSTRKSGYVLPRSKMANSDLSRIINSDEIQSVLKAKRTARVRYVRKKNPLKNRGFMIKLNPYEKVRLRRIILAQQKQSDKKKEAIKAARAKQGRVKKQRAGYYTGLLSNPVIYEK